MNKADYERLVMVFAQELESSIASCFANSSGDDAELLMRRFRGILVASLVGEVEEKINKSFSSVFEQLSDQPTKTSSKYWHPDMPKSSSVRGRAKLMWAIRVAYTHGNGHIDRVSDERLKELLEPNFAKKHFRGLRVENEIVKIFGDVTYPALKTALEIYEKFETT